MAGNKCEICFNDLGELDAHHIFRKQSLALRYSIDNGICLCAACHRYGIHSPNFDDQKRTQDLIQQVKEQKVLNKLRKLKANPPKLKDSDLEKIYENLKQKLNE